MKSTSEWSFILLVMDATLMDDTEIDLFLRKQDTGTLSLTNGQETYAIPKSFGYDGDGIYFQLGYTSESQKMAFIESTDIATFSVFVDNETAASVIVRGEIDLVPEDELVLASSAFAENSVTPMVNIYVDKSLDELDFDFYRLRPDEISGRKFGNDV